MQRAQRGKGFAVLEEAVDSETVDLLLRALANVQERGVHKQRAGHRRVLHFEYSSIELPGALRWFEEPLSDKLNRFL